VSPSRTALLLACLATSACIVSTGGGAALSPTPTPATPTPTPTAGEPTECVIAFQGTTQVLYWIEMPASLWRNGTVDLTAGVNHDPTVDAVFAQFEFAQNGEVGGVATAGSFVLSNIPSTAATSSGAAFSFADTDALDFSVTPAADLTQGGQGSIASGVLSPSRVFLTTSGSSAAIAVNGTASILSDTTPGTAQTVNFGGNLGPSYAGCFVGPAVGY
jgi:hypothetical protein